MTMGPRLALPVLCLALALAGCYAQPRSYQKAFTFEKAVAFRPRRLSKGGDPTNHPCLRGQYSHVYDAGQGLYGDSEVWLCCVPPEDILDGSFDCGSTAVPGGSLGNILGGNDDYWKIRSCFVLHPTATEQTIVPVCIPAPLEAPVDGIH